MVYEMYIMNFADKKSSPAVVEKSRLRIVKMKHKVLIKTQSALLIFQMMLLQAHAANGDIFEKANSLMKTVYKSIAGISSVTAGCVAAVCLYLMFFSKNQRTVDESVQWLKRIIICWLAIMLMSTIIYFITNTLGIGTTATLD